MLASAARPTGTYIARWIAIGAALTLLGCNTPLRGGRDVTITPDVRLVLPKPDTLGRQIDAVQLVTARHAGESFSFEGRLSVTAERLLLVGTDALGRRAMTITWTQHGWTTDRAPGLPDTAQPENVLADIVLMFWPADIVRDALRSSNATLAVENRSRRVRQQGNDVISITYDGDDPWVGITRLRNASWGYELEIRSVVIAP